jgi:pimeloyl-ACP methyl ester carboxylesterase
MDLRYISGPHLIAEAGGDPWAIDDSLQVGRPSQISDLAQAFHNAGRCTAESSIAFDEARRRFEASWNRVTGEHPINDAAEVRRTMQSLGAQSLQLAKIGADLESVAAALAETQYAGAVAISTLETQLRRLDDLLGQALNMEKDSGLTADDRIALDALIRALEQQAIDDTAAALGQLRSRRDGYSQSLQRSLIKLRTDGYDPAALQSMDARANHEELLQIPSPGTSAEEINRWWKTLSAEQQGRLISDHPPELGNLNGVPVAVRSRVNQAVLKDDLRRVEEIATLRGVGVNDVLADPGQYRLPAVAITRYANAFRTQQGLEASDGASDVFLLKYHPEAFGGEGAAAIAIDDPDTAANTAVLVKGAATSVREGTLAEAEGKRLYEGSSRADWGKRTAVVTWVGYDAPNNWFDPALREVGMARGGAQVLAADVNALAVTHEGAPTHMTVVGHSYGSTLVADAAAAYGMHANDVVLVGSPGTDLARSSADFHLPQGGHLYVGAASGDAVTWSPAQVTGPGLVGVSFGGLGNDPAVDGYGSTRFKAEVPGHSMNPVYDHLHYFDDGSESLFSMSDVVSGHGDALQQDGMTARHRGEYGLGRLVDPEVARPGTTGHWHRGPGG